VILGDFKTTRFAGYAAIFNVADKGGDIIRKGAFRSAKAGMPLFWQHDPARRIGTITKISEDHHGLRIIAEIDNSAAAAPVRAGSGLSFGYRVRGMNKGTYRELRDLDLIEVSVVTNPMQPLARVLATESNEGDYNGL
jgi:uncharacterized protein